MQVNKLRLPGLMALCTVFFFLGFKAEKISPKLKEKLDNAVLTTFEVEGFTLELMAVDPKLNQKTPSELGGDNLFKVIGNGSILGYAYLGEAPSMKNIFDYVVLFNPDLSIKKSKILIYREDHGRQVGSQRWLKQFIGRKSGESLAYGEDIDGISGATISAKSMTLAVSNILESMQVLQENKVF
ncbi:FMN-binding protein [Flagellimonas amoyensis]|uniref:FMN-binding protein n=1 Tax=Flagellimonas amoyensis TaxID=2169401 RepID=UPI000D392D45|nr:FMN-binding protein [Allomuricauda amoyensis]